MAAQRAKKIPKSTEFSSKKNFQSSIYEFDRLSDNLILPIHSKTVADHHSRHDNTIYSCRRFNELESIQEVQRNVNLWTMQQHTAVVGKKNRRKLQAFVHSGSIAAMVILGTYLFFNATNRDSKDKPKGINLLRIAATSGDLRAVYILAIAKITRGNINGWKDMTTLMKECKHDRRIIQTYRHGFRSMVRANAFSIFRTKRMCRGEGGEHWDGHWSSIIAEFEADVYCPECLVDVETFKLNRCVL